MLYYFVLYVTPPPGRARQLLLLLFLQFIRLFVSFFRSLFLSVNASGLLASVCRTCRIQYDGRSLHCLLRLLPYNAVSLSFFVTTELVSL